MSRNILIGIVLVAIISLAIFFFWNRSPEIENVVPNTNTENSNNTEEVKEEDEIIYVNEDYNFRFVLPKSWEGYLIIEEAWEGYSIVGENQILSDTGPFVSIRHPDWDYKSPRQDIPIMVFTIPQWNDLKNGKFHIGAAPIDPKELARNSTYVFALPARYNYAFITGYEEVEEILETNPLSGFNP